MGNLLKEAIADAKAIKETALANAKIALEEAFTPQITKLFSEKIQSEIEGDENNLDAPVQQPVQQQAQQPVQQQAQQPAQPVQDVPDIETEPETETDQVAEEFDDLDTSEFDLEEAKDVTSGAGANPEGVGSANGKNKFGQPVAKTTQLKETELGLGSEEDDMNPMDLESIIRELNTESEFEEGEGSDFPENEYVEEAKDVTSGAGANPEGVGSANGKNKFGQPVAKTTQLKETDGCKIEIEPAEEDAVDEVINIDEILRELEGSDFDPNEPNEVDPVQGPVQFENSKLTNENKQLKFKLSDTTKALKEYKTVVTFLKSKLNEINLLNAKLLFTNKLFKAHGLNNSQKMKVIENFDRAKTIREVKLVFATISESLSQTNLALQRPTAKKITEGLASKVSRSTPVKKVAPAPQREVISEGIVSNDAAVRLRKLAGIIK